MATDSLMLHLVMYSLEGLGGSSLFLLQQNFLGSETNGKTSAKTKFLANAPTHYCTKAKRSQRTFLPGTTAIRGHILTFNLRHTLRPFIQFFLTHTLSLYIFALYIPLF